MACVLGAIGSIFCMPRGMFLLFGVVIFGWPGRIALGVVFVLLIATAVLVFQQKMIGWWLLVVTTIVLPISWIITLLRVNLADMYEQMGMNSAQLQAMHINSPAWSGNDRRTDDHVHGGTAVDCVARHESIWR